MLPVLLAAGLGRRLGGGPKSLYPVAEAPLILRAAHALSAAGFGELAVVTGHARDEVQEYCARSDLPLELRWLHNERYADLNNFYTVALACEALSEPLLVLNCDIVFMPEVVRATVDVDAEAAIAVDNSVIDEEAMGVTVRDGRATSLGKHLPPGESVGEFIGVSTLQPPAKAAYLKACGAALDAGESNLYYEDIYARIAADVDIGVANVAQADWAEIDSPEDVPRVLAVAERQSEVLPVPSSGGGPV